MNHETHHTETTAAANAEVSAAVLASQTRGECAAVPAVTKAIPYGSLEHVAMQVAGEVAIAMKLHAKLNSAHEAYAVIAEELDEFWDIVKLRREQRNPAGMRKELLHTAAMCVRAIIDLGL